MPSPQGYVWNIYNEAKMEVELSAKSRLRWKVEGYLPTDKAKKDSFVRYMHPADVFDALLDLGEPQNADAIDTLEQLAIVFDFPNRLFRNEPSLKARHTPKFPFHYLFVRNEDKDMFFSIILHKISDVRWKADCHLADDPQKHTLTVIMHPTDILGFLCAITVPEVRNTLETLEDLAYRFWIHDKLPYSKARYQDENGKPFPWALSFVLYVLTEGN